MAGAVHPRVADPPCSSEEEQALVSLTRPFTRHDADFEMAAVLYRRNFAHGRWATARSLQNRCVSNGKGGEEIGYTISSAGWRLA